VKYALLVGDGMADRPLEVLRGRTPLQVARTPWMDEIAQKGLLGRVRTIPPGFPPGSDVANLVILGYDPKQHFTGRGPLEAAAMGVRLGQADVAFRCNLVHVSLAEDRPRMVDFTGGHIRTGEARPIIEALHGAMGNDEVRFHAGVSYRHLLVWRGGPADVKTTPPHDITGQEIAPYLPRGNGAERILEWMKRAQQLLGEPAFRALMPSENEQPPNAIWPWGQGKAPALEPITGRWGIRGAIITAVDLLRGLGTYAGLRVVDVPGATGYYDTDYAAKARYALAVLEEGDDFVFVHVEAADEAGHQGSVEEKVRAIESFDREVVGTVLQGVQRYEDWAVLVLPDHATPIEVKTHTDEPVPFGVLSSRGRKCPGGAFEEDASRKSPLYVEEGTELLGRFIEGRWE
jgi:2,3-bisphosphoglycerate-independent phosphoglycerate mutase